MIRKTLKQLRLFHQLTQGQMARKAGICESLVCEIESCKRPLSTFALARYLSAFSLTAEELTDLYRASDGGEGIDFGLLQALLDMKKP